MIYKDICSIVYAIWLRAIKKSLADKWTVALAIGWPLFLIFLVGKGIDSFVNVESLGISYTNFLGPGVIAFFAMSGALYSGNSMIEDKKGAIKEMLVAPISRISIFIGNVLGEMTISFAFMLVIVSIFLVFVNSFSINVLFWVFWIMVLIAFGFYGLGVILGFLFKRSKSYEIFTGLIMTFIIFLSGAFFPVKNLPIWIKVFTRINPLTYGVDGLRNVMVGYGDSSLLFDITFLIFFCLTMIALGSYVFKKFVEG